MNVPARLLVFAVLAIAVMFMIAAPAFAADASPTFAATFFQDIAGNRSKIIQLSIVFVLIGIALLFKK